MSAQEFMLHDDQKIAAYSEFEAQLASLEKENAVVVFDYASTKGEKDARSHIHKLRRTKGAVEKVRKTEKQAALDYGKEVDSQAKEVVARIEAMIDVHQTPLDEIAERETVRVANIQERIARIRAVIEDLPDGIDELRNCLNDAGQIVVDESFEEFTADASVAKKEVLTFIEDILARREEQAELERLRVEKEGREREDRERQIQADAEAKAKADADIEAKRLEAERETERKAEAERIRAAEARAKRAVRDQQEAERVAAEQLIQAKKDAENAAAIAKAAAEREQRERVEAEQAEQLKREQDKQHKAQINRGALAGLVKCGCGDDLAKDIVEAIVRGEVPHVTIAY